MKQVNNIKLESELKAGKDKRYKVEAIRDSTAYENKAAKHQLPGFYYLIFGKGYSEAEHSLESTSAVMHL